MSRDQVREPTIPLSASDFSEDASLRPHNSPWLSGKIPLAAILAIVTIVCLESMLVRLRHYYYDAYTIMLDDKRQLLKSAPADVLIFGNSRGHHVDPEQVSQALPGQPEVKNVTWAWCGVEIYYAELKARIATGNIPATVIVDGFPEMFTYPETSLSVVNNPHFLSGYAQIAPPVAGVYTLLRQHLPAEAWEAFTIYATPPSARYRRFLLPNAKKFLKDGDWPYPPLHYDDIVRKIRQDGWFLCVPPEQVAPESVFLDLQKTLSPLVLRKNERIVKAYERFISLADEHNIKIIMVGMPANPVFHKVFSDNGAYGAYDEWLDKMQQRYDTFAAPAPRYYSEEGILGDPWHVNQKGAQIHMQILTETLENLGR